MLTKSQKDEILFLWNREYPKRLNETRESFEAYLQKTENHQHFLMLDDANEIIGWAYTFDRDGERWFSIIINSLYHGIGLGRKMLDQLKQTEERLNGWVIDGANEIKLNGEFYPSPLIFYLKNDFEVLPDIRFETDKISDIFCANFDC